MHGHFHTINRKISKSPLSDNALPALADAPRHHQSAFSLPSTSDHGFKTILMLIRMLNEGEAYPHNIARKFIFLALHQRRGQAPSTGNFSDRFLINSPAISAAQNAHTQAVIFKVTKAVRTPLNQLHFAVKTFCDAVIPGKPEHSGHFFPPIMQRLAQGAQRREGRFSKLINFIQ